MTLSVWNWHFNRMSGDLGREIQNLQQYWFQFQFQIWVWTAFVFVFAFSILFAFVLLPSRWWQHVLGPCSHYNSVKLKHKRRELILISIRHKRSRLYFICTFEYIIVPFFWFQRRALLAKVTIFGPKKWHFEWPNQNSKTTFIVRAYFGPFPL